MESLGKVKQRHKMEERKLAADVKALQKSAKGLTKQELKARVDAMEAELAARHEAELSAFADPDAAAAVAPPAADAPPDAPAGETEGSREKSKAQRKREKKSAKEREEREELEAYRASAVDPRVEEMRLLAKILEPLRMAVHEIPADGHCLFRSVSHQLGVRSGLSVGVDALRRQAAEYIAAHAEDVAPFLPYEESDGFDADPAAALRSYCERLVSTAAWGGHPELQALAHTLNRAIVVYQAEAEPLRFGTELPLEPLTITFHRRYYVLGDHYNSVVPLE